jgi:hypothetical protein
MRIFVVVEQEMDEKWEVTESLILTDELLLVTLTSNPLVRTVTQCHRVFLNPRSVGPSICTHT